MKVLTIQEVENVAFALAQEILAFDEPIPDFATRFPNKLESCIAMPFMRYSGQYYYKGLVEKAAILFYLIIKNHPFQNGNKRVAIATVLFFLSKNGKWLNADTDELYRLTLWTADSLPVVKNAVVEGIKTYFQKRLIDFEET